LEEFCGAICANDAGRGLEEDLGGVHRGGAGSGVGGEFGVEGVAGSGGEAAEVAAVFLDGSRKGLDIALSAGASALFLNSAHGCEGEAGEDGDHGDDDEEFDEGKRRCAAFRR
jgi:hypothetical protein